MTHPTEPEVIYVEGGRVSGCRNHSALGGISQLPDGEYVRRVEQPTEAGEQKVFTNNEETTMKTERFCCQMDCEKDAEFEIFGESGHPEDCTDACADHVGHLLGTPTWLTEGGREENRSWTVVYIGEEPDE